MFIHEILDGKTREIKTVAPSEALEYCAAHMKLDDVGALVVCENGRHLRGIIAERDIVRALVDHGARALRMCASDVMDRHPITCRRSDSIASVGRRMTQARVRHVPVLEHGAIVGIVSLGDIVKVRFEEMELESGVLRDMAGAHLAAL